MIDLPTTEDKRTQMRLEDEIRSKVCGRRGRKGSKEVMRTRIVLWVDVGERPVRTPCSLPTTYARMLNRMKGVGLVDP